MSERCANCRHWEAKEPLGECRYEPSDPNWRTGTIYTLKDGRFVATGEVDLFVGYPETSSGYCCEKWEVMDG